jgi:transglutaminase-like putative cysteine protease
MKCSKWIITLFLFVYVLKVDGQEFKLGKVSVAELEEKEHPKDPSAAAAILFKKGEVKFEYNKDKGFTMSTVVKTRVKIYKKEGYNWANHMVSYYSGDNTRETVSFNDAVTFNLVGGVIEKTKLKSEGVFDEQVNKYWKRKKIAMPNVKEGSVVEYEYTIRSQRLAELTEWFFQTSIPVNHSELITYIPEYFVYNATTKGFIFASGTAGKVQNGVTYSYAEKADQGENAIKRSYLAENLAAIKEEAFVSNIDNYTPSISHELAMTKFPNALIENFSTNWESVTKKIYENEDFGAELRKTGYFEEDIAALLKGLTSQEEKIAAIYNFVKTKVKWNDFYGYSCNEGVKKAYKDKVGNIAEINLMLTAMLRYAELTANPVLVSTRSNGIAVFPNRTAFNYVVAAVETPEGLVLLDASDKFAAPNILPFRALNWMGRLIRKDGTSTQVDLMPKVLSREAINISYAFGKNGVVNGKVRNQFTNHEAWYFRQKNVLSNKNSYLESLESANNNIEIGDYARENELDLTKPVVENYSFQDSKSVEMINDKIYLSPLIFLATKENPFKQEVREYPIDFGYPTERKYIINIEIPAGYVVESLPKAMNIATGGDVCFFKYSIGNEDGRVTILINSSVNAAVVSADFYDVLKDFYQQMIDKKNEKIVLRKV